MFDLRARARQAVLDAGFSPDLPAEAQAELRSPGEPETDPAIRDLRDLPCSSIDNDGSRDLDQVEWAEETVPGQEARLLVGIADVDSLVPRGSALDAHAAHNATSVYAGAAVFPMLPSELSTDRSSLVGGAERLTVVTEMRINLLTGETLAYDIYRARLRNAAALTYETLAPWFENRAPAPPPQVTAVPGLTEQLQLQLRVARALRGFRQRAGAVAFSSVEARPVTRGDTGEVTGLTLVNPDAGRELIESFMIAANVSMARFLHDHASPVLRRVVHTPGEAAWERMRAIAAEHGDALPAGPADPRALGDFLARRRAAETPDGFAALSLSIVKLLGAGEYVAQMPGAPAEGHFGLAAPDYSHSTAPNRRFADVLTQRLLKAALHGQPAPYPAEELAALAAHCTERDSAARKVERLMRKVAAAALLAPRVGETFAAVVTGSSPKGVYVRLRPPGPPAEGRVVRGPTEHPGVGARVTVRLLGVDAARGFIDFAVEPS